MDMPQAMGPTVYNSVTGGITSGSDNLQNGGLSIIQGTMPAGIYLDPNSIAVQQQALSTNTTPGVEMTQS